MKKITVQLSPEQMAALQRATDNLSALSFSLSLPPVAFVWESRSKQQEARLKEILKRVEGDDHE